VKLANSFTIDRPVGEVYDAFLDVERIATCMPGSRLLGQPEPGTYEGEVKVKVGPLGVAYTGQFTVLEADEKQRRLTMRAKGREQRGAGNADAFIVAELSEQPGGTLVRIDTELSIRGKVAQFGRGVIGEVTDGIMQTFATNVEQMLLAGGPTPTGSIASPSAAPTTSPGSAAPPGEATATAVAASDLDGWSLIIRPMLQRHSGSLATVALAGIAAYLGARAGSRSRRH
jgi:carbon monoxide dehydrogenase subunit G